MTGLSRVGHPGRSGVLRYHFAARRLRVGGIADRRRYGEKRCIQSKQPGESSAIRSTETYLSEV